jgi:hypothetical protein
LLAWIQDINKINDSSYAHATRLVMPSAAALLVFCIGAYMLLLRLHASPGPLLGSIGSTISFPALCYRQQLATATGSGSRATIPRSRQSMLTLRRWAALAQKPQAASRCDFMQDF